MATKTTSNVSELGSAALRKLASQLKIKNYSRIQKPNLIVLVEQAQANMKKETKAKTTPATAPTVEDNTNELIASDEALRAQYPANVEGSEEFNEAVQTEQTQEVPEIPQTTVEADKPANKGKAVRIPVTKEMKKIIEDTEIVKSEKFRKLNQLGMSASQIAKETGSHYSFVHGVLQRQTTLIA